MSRLMALASLAVASPVLASSWATSVQSYDAGTNPAPGYTNAAAALGEPTRMTGGSIFPGAVTPFNTAWMDDEIVSIGAGGSIVVQFDTPVTNHPDNPYGIDLLIFGNTWFLDSSFPDGVAQSIQGAGRGFVEVSANGTDWAPITSAEADTLYPTLGYADLTDPYAGSPGSVLTDFTRPVDPSFDPIGKTFAQISAAYAGSGGGTGIDIGSTGLASISFVRISNPWSTGTVEIDAITHVTPVPAPAAAAALGLLLLPRRRRDGAARP